MQPGDLLQEGVVVRLTDAGAMVGLEVDAEAKLPPRHTEHMVSGRRVFLSLDQAPIEPHLLHPTTAAKGKARHAAEDRATAATDASDTAATTPKKKRGAR